MVVAELGPAHLGNWGMSITHELEKYHKACDKGYQELKTNIKT
jgi:hypothetical protein